MKANIHPKWNHQAKVTCSCGNTFVTGSVKDDIQVDICSNCHPFFTGEMRFVDVQGRVDKFMAKRTAAQAQKATKKKKTDKKQEDSLSLRELMLREKKKAAAQPQAQ